MGNRIERRVVTVLFCDLVGFTSLAEQLDPEDVAIVQEAYFSVVRDAVDRYGGTLEKFIGDAAVAVFGVPTARDDDAERAVRAGMALTSAVQQLPARINLPAGTLTVRVGVNTGEAAVYLDARPGEGIVTGDTINVAARLQSAAPSGGVLLGETTAFAVADAIEMEPLAPIELKGKALPVRPSVAVAPFPERSRDAAMGALRAPTIGREDELDQLGEAMAQASEGHAVRVLIVAPPGVGKTRLVTEFGARADARGAFRSAARLRPEVIGPFQPVAQLLVGALGRAGVEVGRSDQRDLSLDLLRDRLIRSGASPAAAERSAEAALDTAWPLEQRSGRARSGNGLIAAWIDTLDALAERSPAVWIVEDVHWAGPDLLSFLTDAHARPSTHGRLVVCTARPSLLETAAAWSEEPGTALVHLAPLSFPRAADLVHGLIGDALPSVLVDRIARHSDGNALFIEELLRMWIGLGTLERSGGRWILAREQQDLAIPATVQAIYAAQLDDLPAAARIVVRHASVAGPRFPAASLGALDAPGWAEGVDALLRRALFTGPFPAGAFGDMYAFRHALLRDAAYASLARADRSRLHVRLARWFERLPTSGRPEVAEVIGGHYEAAVRETPTLASDVGEGLDRAGASTMAAEWLLRSVERSIGAAGNRAAQELVARAVQLVSGDQPELEARLELQQSLLTFLEGDGRASLEHAERAIRIAERLGSGGLIVQSTVNLAWMYAGGDQRHALELVDRAMRYPEAEAFESVYDAPRTLRGLILMNRGELGPARAELRRQLEAARERDHASTNGIHLHLAELEYRAGRWRDGLRHAVVGLRSAEEHEDAQGMGSLRYVRALHRGVLGRVEAATADATRGLEISRDLGDEVFAAQSSWVLGLLALSQGRTSDALEHLEPLQHVAARIGATDPNSWLLFEPDLIEAMIGEARVAEAGELTESLEARALVAGFPRGTSVAARSRALLELAVGDHEAAIEAAAAAVATPGIDAQPFEVARALHVRATAEAAAGRREAARRTLDEAAAGFHRLGARLWSGRVEATAAALRDV